MKQKKGKYAMNILDVMDMRKRDDINGLIEAADYADVAVRAEAVSSLGSLRNSHAVDPLINKLMNDSDPYVRSLAAAALGSIGDAKARSALMNAFENDTLVVSSAAAKALTALSD